METVFSSKVPVVPKTSSYHQEGAKNGMKMKMLEEKERELLHFRGLRIEKEVVARFAKEILGLDWGKDAGGQAATSSSLDRTQQRRLVSSAILRVLEHKFTSTQAQPPISHFRLPSLALFESGEAIVGLNVEFEGACIASTVHTEQFVLACAFTAAMRRKMEGLSCCSSPMTHLALTCTPCGHCRQILHETGSADTMEIVLLVDQHTREGVKTTSPPQHGSAVVVAGTDDDEDGQIGSECSKQMSTAAIKTSENAKKTLNFSQNLTLSSLLPRAFLAPSWW